MCVIVLPALGGANMTETQANYKETLNLPQTDFAMKANLVQREPQQRAAPSGSTLLSFQPQFHKMLAVKAERKT